MTDPKVLLEVRDQVATVTFNRPEQMNPFDWDTVKYLKHLFGRLDSDPLRIIIFTGKGRAFSAGGDLKTFVSLYRDKDAYAGFLQDLHDLFEEMEWSSKIVIAAVNGYCLAGGIELMLACDLVIASEEAPIGDADLNFGQLPGGGGSQRLTRLLGPLRAKHLFLTGD
jgi:enoyl-CoA hydratase